MEKYAIKVLSPNGDYIEIGDNKYVKNKTIGDKYYLVCKYRRTKKCKGSAVVERRSNRVVVLSTTDHNHEEKTEDGSVIEQKGNFKKSVKDKMV